MAYGPQRLAGFDLEKPDLRVTIKHVIDGLIYGLLTAGTFGWLWPK
jgi:hypothetical protein